MESVQSLDDIYLYYQRHDSEAPFQTMIQFLDLIGDVLRSKDLRYVTSCGRLVVYPNSTDISESASILVNAEREGVMSLTYQVHWDDGPLCQRWRDEGVRRPVAEARHALIGMLERLMK
jgi:hypothetical protein